MKKSFDNETNVLYYVIAYLSVMLKMRTVNKMNDFRRLLRDVLAYSAAGCCKDFSRKIGDFLRFSSGMLANLESVIHSRKMLSRARLTGLYGENQQCFTQQKIKVAYSARRLQ